MRTSRWIAGAAIAGLLAGCGGGSGGTADAGVTADGGGSEVTIESGDLWFEPESVTVDAGEVTFTLDNTAGAAEHDLVIEELDDLEVVYTGPGEVDSATVELEAGSYTFYCSVPGHRAQMEGTIAVS